MPLLENRVAIVTGAGQGVGRGIALAMAKEGAAIALVGRTRGTLAKVQAEIEAFGGRATIAVGDVKSADDIRNAVAHAAQTFGGIDILINNAQEVALGTLLDVTDDSFLDGFLSGPL